MGFENDLLRDTPRGIDGKEPGVASARWANPENLGPEWAYSRKSIFLGYRDGRAIGCGDDRHVMLVAGSRAGKGVSFVIPNLLLYEGSILAIDPKGELAKETARARATRKREGEPAHRVVVVDPFGVSGEATLPYRGGFNPLDEIDPGSDTAVDDAGYIAEALVVADDTGAHWVNGARELVKALILFALLQEPEWRNLTTVRNVLRQPPEEHNGKTIPSHILGLQMLAECGDAFGGAISAIGNSFLGKEERELNSLVSTVDIQLAFLDSQPLAPSFKRSDFALSELKTGALTVYLCLPATRMDSHSKWLRTVFNLALLMAENVRTKPGPPVLFLLEEFPVLGYMRSIESAAGQIAGLGIKLFTVVQDLTQLKKLYKESWETFIGNAGVLIFFGNADVTTLEYVSKKLGNIGFDLRRATGIGVIARLAGDKVINEQLQLNKLLEMHEAERMLSRETLRALVLSPGIDPLIVRRAIYHNDPAFKELL